MVPSLASIILYALTAFLLWFGGIVCWDYTIDRRAGTPPKEEGLSVLFLFLATWGCAVGTAWLAGFLW